MLRCGESVKFRHCPFKQISVGIRPDRRSKSIGPNANTNRFSTRIDIMAITYPHRPIQTRTGPVPTCFGRHQSRAGPYRLSNGLCWCLTFDIDRHRPLETRYGLTQTGPRLVPVQASWGRLVPVPRRDRKKRCISF